MARKPFAPLVLIVLDGWGVAPTWGGNAVSLARTPFLDLAGKKFPFTTIGASAEDVGLPVGERGNSEVGHLNIGSGQIVHQSLPSISEAIKDGSFYRNEALLTAYVRAKQSNRAVHLIGLLSDGGIHSHIEHLYGLLEIARRVGCREIYIHAITDGRDTQPFISQQHLSNLNAKLRGLGFGTIATVSGRFYAMDRDHRWERIEAAYRAITEGVGATARTAEAAVAEAYRQGFSDEFIQPTIIQDQNSFRPLGQGDSVIFFNFRADRARELTRAILEPKFNSFRRKVVLKDLYFVGFTFYREGLPMVIAFRPRDVHFPLARVLAVAGWRQLHIGESEKYAHVTYFFNGGQETAYKGEDRTVIDSPKTGSYDQTPEMATAQIASTIVKRLGKYDFIIGNFASPDMVGHTGNLRATVTACEQVDKHLKAIYRAVHRLGGTLIVTADHGNAEQMVNPKTGEPDTEHTGNRVPFYLIAKSAVGWQLRSNGQLRDIAPTILGLFKLACSEEMTGSSLIASEHQPATELAVY
ncbi:MAG: 2,3-bisphosphoglycerate-independent phosphoglycerate mutase [Patescibacteria group bacterium]